MDPVGLSLDELFAELPHLLLDRSLTLVAVFHNAVRFLIVHEGLGRLLDPFAKVAQLTRKPLGRLHGRFVPSPVVPVDEKIHKRVEHLRRELRVVGGQGHFHQAAVPHLKDP